MFELSKKILTNVSFDKALFAKEFAKALRYLRSDERLLLKVWAIATFGNAYRDLIVQIFRSVTKT